VAFALAMEMMEHDQDGTTVIPTCTNSSNSPKSIASSEEAKIDSQLSTDRFVLLWQAGANACLDTDREGKLELHYGRLSGHSTF